MMVDQVGHGDGGHKGGSRYSTAYAHQKGCVISAAYAMIQPLAMMIEICHALITGTAI